MAICTVGGWMDGCEVVLLSLHYRGFSSVLVHRVAGSGTITNPTDRSGRRSAAHVRTERWHASSARRCAHRGNQGSQNVTLSALSVESDQTQSMVVALYDVRLHRVSQAPSLDGTLMMLAQASGVERRRERRVGRSLIEK